jgi:hypothetical protein
LVTATRARTRKPAAVNGKPAEHAPRPRSRTTAAKPAPISDAETEIRAATRATAALKIATAAQRKAARVASDVEVNRSTRTRAALRLRSDALDDVVAVLAGKNAA